MFSIRYHTFPLTNVEKHLTHNLLQEIFKVFDKEHPKEILPDVEKLFMKSRPDQSTTT